MADSYANIAKFHNTVIFSILSEDKKRGCVKIGAASIYKLL